MTITINEASSVRPAEETPRRHLWLSNLDVLQGRIHLPSVYLYKPDGSSNFFATKVLKEALSKVIVPFYPVAGRLGVDRNGRTEINCNAEGVLFVEAETDSPMSDLWEFTNGSINRQLVPKVDYSKDISSIPLVLLQVTRFTCGGVCLGVGWQHVVADGQGATNFINSWAEAARGLPIRVQPVLERNILGARHPPTPGFHHQEYDPPPKFNIQSEEDPKPLSLAILKIPNDLINALKDKVNKESNVKYSTYKVLTAHLWRCTIKAMNFSSDQVNMLVMPVDGRSRLNPPVPDGYFGNVVFHAKPKILSGDLNSESLISTVKRIHNELSCLDDEYLKSAIDFLEKTNGPGEAMHVVRNDASPIVRITSWVRLPVGCTDFGWGRPQIMRPAYLLEGMGYLLPSFSGDDTLSVMLCLQDEHMKAFKKLLFELE